MRKFKLNVIDVVIIVVLIAVIAAGGYFFLKYNRADQLEGKSTTIRFQVEVPELTQQVAEGFTVGAPVIYGNTNSDEGTIVDVKIAPYEKTLKNTQDGTFTWEQFGDKVQATVTIEAQVTETENAYRGKDTEIQVGANMPFHGRGFAAPKGFIVGIEAE